MNFKLITTLYTLSACTIAQTVSQSAVQAATVENPLQPDASTVAIQPEAVMIQLENKLIRTMAQPETFSTTPEILTAAPSTEVSLVEVPLVEVSLVEVPLVEGPTAEAPSPEAPMQLAQAQDRYRPQAPRIEVGTQGIPAITDLPDRVSLPQQMLFPVNFENPINLGQAMDSSIPTSSPITDQMADPTWSRRLEDLAAYKTAYSQNLVAWSDRISQCMTEKPKLYVMRSDGKQLPIYFDGKEGTIVQNKDGVAVCAL
jgi:hypothetical protein